jgi:formylglycine-generating enzyme required for sulfatase activity
MNRLKSPKTLSLVFLTLLLLIAVFRHLAFTASGMTHFDTRVVMLGGESAAVLQTLREQKTIDIVDVDSLLPERQTFTPQKQIFISRHEVTNNQYRRFLNQTMMKPESLKNFTHPSIDPNHNFRPKSMNDVKYSDYRQPIINVSWHDANAFCHFINMRLPTANEFEAVFQLESKMRDPGEYDYPQLPDPKDNSIEMAREVVPAVVGKYQSARGVFHDVIGNVMEWVQPLAGRHLLMGYSYKQYGQANDLKTFHPFKRFYSGPNTIGNDFGFRCVYEVEDPAFLLHPAMPATVNRDGVECWQTRAHLGAKQFDLLNQDNRMHAGGSLIFPDELCELPQKTYQLGPNKSQSSTELLRENAMGFAQYLLGKPPETQTVKGFWLDHKEVSIAQYQAFLTSSSDLHRHPEQPQTHDRQPLGWDKQLKQPQKMAPVTGVSWWDAFAYCSVNNKRLPFTTEWERASKSRDGRMYSWGNDLINDTGMDKTPENISGLTKDVSEWTSTFVVGTDTAIVKGGSELFDWKIFGRAYVELKVSRSTKSPSIGFRCARGG